MFIGALNTLRIRLRETENNILDSKIVEFLILLILLFTILQQVES